MIIIKTYSSDLIINEMEVASIIYIKKGREAKISYKDGVTIGVKLIDRIDMHPGTPDMTFVNNVEPDPDPEPVDPPQAASDSTIAPVMISDNSFLFIISSFNDQRKMFISRKFPPEIIWN